MKGSQLQHYIVLCYLLFWVSRIRGIIRRVKQPHLRGAGWFFDVPVGPDFCNGPGRAILRGYWLRMAIPFVLDVPAFAMLLTGHTTWLLWLLVALVPAIHVNHLYNVKHAERQAWQFAKADEAKAAPTSSVSLSLTPRRLRDYTNWPLEWVLGLATLASALVLVHLYRTVPDRHNLRQVFWVPALYLYLQLGILLVKRIIVAWRTPLPTAQTSEYRETREATRKYYLLMCDWNRIVPTAGIAFWPVLLTVPHARFDLLMKLWLGIWLALTIAGGIWIEIRRKQLAEISVKARPVRPPDLLGQSGMTRWPVCYQPEVPMLVLQGSRGYSLNLANTTTYFGAAYLVGMVLLLMLPRVRHWA